MKPLAGNQTDARKRAQQNYKSAAKSGASKQDLDVLFAAYAAAQAKENSACGTSYQARKQH